MVSHSSRKGRLMKGRESIRVKIRAACSVRGTSGDVDVVVDVDADSKVSGAVGSGFEVAVSNRWRTSWRIVEDSIGSCSEITDGDEVTRTRVLMAILNWREERFCGKTCG